MSRLILNKFFIGSACYLRVSIPQLESAHLPLVCLLIIFLWYLCGFSFFATLCTCCMKMQSTTKMWIQKRKNWANEQKRSFRIQNGTMIFNSSFVRWCIYCDSIAIICVSARFCALASISFFLPSSNVRFLSSKTIKLHRRIMNTLCYILALKSSFGSVPDKKKSRDSTCVILATIATRK